MPRNFYVARLIYLDAGLLVVIKYILSFGVTGRDCRRVWKHKRITGGELIMNRYSKMLLSLLLMFATALFFRGITADKAFAAFQDEGEETEMTEEEYEAYMAEYTAWDEADKEADIIKSGAMLLEFIQKNQKSTLVPYAEGSYQRLLAKCIEEKKFQELETLAEQWNTYKPGDENTVRMIAVAAKELKHTEKYLGALEEMYKRTPQLDFAKEIAGIHKESKNDAKYIEWIEIVLKEETDSLERFRINYDLFNYYLGKNDSSKIMEYAQATLKAIEQLQNPPAEIAKNLPEIRHALNHNIGVIHFNAKRYDEATTYFMNALRNKKYSNGYYQIGTILWERKMILNARLAFAKAQLLGESAQASSEDKSVAPRAKERMEQLHKSLQNDTLIGIDRQYKRAQEMADEDLLKPME